MNSKARFLFISLPLVLAACGVGASPTQRPPTNAPPTGAPQTPAPTPAPTDPVGSTDPASLNGRQFLSVKVTDGGAPYPLVPGTTIRITFQDGTLSAQAGCNTMSGAYSIVDGKLVAQGGWATTEMGCDPARHSQDEWLSTLLSSQPVIVIDGDKVTITSGSTVIEMLDREVAEPDVQLTGQNWTLNSIITADAVSSVPAGVTASMQFNDDGTVAFQSGCNSGGGSYTVDGQTLTFSNLVMTEMACAGPQSAVEAAFIAVLSADSVDFVIDAAQLTLLAGDSGLQFIAS